jgi:ferrous iron transport protein A
MILEIPLSELDIGRKAKISRILGKGAARRRMIDMGMTRGSEVEIIRKAPMGDPIDIRVKGYHLTMRKAEAEQIIVTVDESS